MSTEEPTRGDGRNGPLPAHERTSRGDRGTEEVPVNAAIDGTSGIDASWLLEHTNGGQAVLAADGTILFLNPAFLNVSGRVESSLLGTRFQELLSVGGRIFYETQFTPMLLLRGALSEVSFDLLGSDRTRLPVFLSAVIAPNPEGSPKRILLTLSEATQRKQYEEELLRARREFEQVAEVVRRSSDAIFSVTADGRIQSWNKGAELIFGLTDSEAHALPLVSIFTKEHGSALAAAIARLKRGDEVSAEMHAVRKDGESVEVDVSLTPHMEAPGILVAFSAVIRDSTSRKRVEKALLQNEKLASVGRLASSIAHEINNPLEAVTNLLYILETRVSEPDLKSFVVMAQEELARVSQMTTHTLRFHKQSSERTSLDLGALTESVFALYRARLRNQNITPVNDSTRASLLYCFEGEMRQIFVNLVSNAFDAMRTGGQLIIRCRDVTLYPSGRKGVRITVADTGSGMDAYTLARLFEPFFSTKGIGGTGLGMWIAQDLIRKNNGEVRIRSSDHPSRSGTVITMTFPHGDIPLKS